MRQPSKFAVVLQLGVAIDFVVRVGGEWREVAKVARRLSLSAHAARRLRERQREKEKCECACIGSGQVWWPRSWAPDALNPPFLMSEELAYSNKENERYAECRLQQDARRLAA